MDIRTVNIRSKVNGDGRRFMRIPVMSSSSAGRHCHTFGNNCAVVRS